MKEKFQITVTIELDAKLLFGTSCGGAVPYELAEEEDIRELIKQDIELIDSMEVTRIDFEDEKDQYITSLEEECENLSKQNTDLTNRISEFI